MLRGMIAVRSMCLANDGTWAAIAGPSGVHVAGLDRSRPAVLHAEAVVDLAAVGAEIWGATTGRRLVRFRAGLGMIAADELWGEGGVLRACATGEPGALWSAPEPAVVLATGERSAVALPIEPDCVIPVSPTRWVVCHRDRIQLRDPGTERWSVRIALGRGRVIDGAVLFGGRAVALLIGGPTSLAHLIVLALRDGSVQHRIGLAGIERVRFAATRGFALMHVTPSSLVLFDLRFGHVLKEHRVPRPVLDAAINDTGHGMLLRFSVGHEDIAFCSIAELLAAPSSGGGGDGAGEADEPVAAADGAPFVHAADPGVGIVVVDIAAADEVAAAPDDDDPAHAFHAGQRPLPAAACLAPRAPADPVSPEAAAALLGCYRELSSALAGAAIARAWDDGRLSASDDQLPFHAEVLGLRGRASGRAGDDVAHARRDVEGAFAALRAETRRHGAARTPLGALARELRLSDTAQLVLVAVAAPALWGELARLYGILANDEARPVVDELLLAHLLASHADRATIARELDRDAPLVRYGVVRYAADKMRPFAALTCEPLVLRLLRGAAVEVDLHGMTVVRDAVPFEQLLVPAEVKDDVAARLAAATATEAGRVVIRGRPGSGRHAMAAALGAAANRALAILDATALARDLRARAHELIGALHRANLAGMLPCVDGLEALPPDDPSARDTVRRILDEHPGPLVVRLPRDGEPPLAPGYLAIDLPPLSMAQRTASWRVLLDAHGLFVRNPDDLADRFPIGPATIAQVCAHVAAPAPAAPAAPAELGDAGAGAGIRVDASLALEAAIRQHLDLRLRATATRVERLAPWSRVILPPDIQQSVLELISRIKHRRTVYDTWGLGEILTTSRGVTALFQGGPGTGKTLVASAIANELGMDLYRVDLSRIMSKWIGETEQNLAKLFDAAEQGHTIVLFDEADSLFAKRTEVRTSVDRYANLEVNYLLQRLDTFEGIAILTTNFGTAIDSAFKRRLSFRLTFPFPDEEARADLWRVHLPPRLRRAGDLDLRGLARRYQLSGGYIRNAALRAAFLAAEERGPLTHDHLERAIKAEFREIGKITDSGVLE